MLTNIDKCLAALEAFSPEKLHQTNCKLRSDLGCTEWRLAISLLATQRQEVPREFDCSSLADYAEKKLELAPQKANELVSTARVMENLPRFSDAFRAGRLSWTKARALKRVITPETEEIWLDYARGHSSREVERRVVQSPREWKRSQAIEASLEGQPKASREEVQQLLVAHTVVAAAVAPPPSAESAIPPNVTAKPAFTDPEPNPVLPAPKFVRLTIDLTHDQFAIYQAMEERVWAKKGRRVARAEVLMELCKLELDRGSSRARARHQVIIHANEKGQAWYETERGSLPVGPEILEEALKRRPALKEAETSAPNTTGKPTAVDEHFATSARNISEAKNDRPVTYARNSREDVTNEDIRAAFARAGNKCERCGARGVLNLHHRKPVADGGSNCRENLELLCGPCHALEHASDFEERPEWSQARARRIESRGST